MVGGVGALMLGGLMLADDVGLRRRLMQGVMHEVGVHMDRCKMTLV